MKDVQPIDEILGAWALEALQAAFPGEEFDTRRIGVVATNDDKHGDYQCNAAMALAKQLKKAPRDIAQVVADHQPLPESVEKIEIAGPGFVNFTLTDAWLGSRVQALLQHDRLGVKPVGEGQTVVIDYSSPNVAKPMHIGHIRSTVIGNALDRMHRFLGYNVIADNHLGDWGTQFGKLIMGYRHFLDEDALAEDPVVELERCYVTSNNKCDQDEEWLDACRQELVKLQQGDEENLALWKMFIDLSMKEFDATYGRLGVSFDLTRGESYYNDALPGILEALEAKGLLVESEGAKVVDLEDKKMGVAIVQKRDGGFNYTTSDLATVKSRIEEFAPAAIVYVTDDRQQLHFKQFFHISKELGYETDLVHIWFGLMSLPEGAIATRAGNAIKLELLLDEATQRALAIVQDKSADMPEAQQLAVAAAVGLGAVKYADLSQNPKTEIMFSWDKAMAMNGNSAPYLQYAHARTGKVLADYADAHPANDLATFAVQLETPNQRRIAALANRFGEVLEVAVAQYRPNLLAEYLYELAQLNSSFYQDRERPWLKADSPERESRLQLAALVAGILKQGLNLLGIEAPERV